MAVLDDEETVEPLERHRGHGEEVERNNHLVVTWRNRALDSRTAPDRKPLISGHHGVSSAHSGLHLNTLAKRVRSSDK